MDRVLSAYEFATEVAARSLDRKLAHRADPKKVCMVTHSFTSKPRILWQLQTQAYVQTDTRHVWPWSYLVTMLEARIQQAMPVAVEVFFVPSGITYMQGLLGRVCNGLHFVQILRTALKLTDKLVNLELNLETLSWILRSDIAGTAYL